MEARYEYIAELELVVSGTGDESTTISIPSPPQQRHRPTTSRCERRNRVGTRSPVREVAQPPVWQRTPGAPTGLTAQAGDEEVTLSWTAPSDNGGEPITGYEYLHREESENYPATGPPPAARRRQ